MSEREIYELDIDDLNEKKKEDLEKILKYIEKYVDYERNRLKNIQSKASLYIGAFSISITILSIFLNNILTSTVNNTSNENILIIFCLIVIIILLSIATIYAIKVFEKESYYTFGSHNDIKKILRSECVLREIIVQFYNSTQKNRKVINKKVDYMNLSQKYFESAICVTIVSVFIFVIVKIAYFYL